jgi:GNAT superfamily N-acetyltransferase
MRDGLLTGAGTSFGPAFWDQVLQLYDTAWPGMSRRLAASEALGFPWAACTTPFVWVEGGRPLAHVGVLAHPLRLHGEDRIVAGLHAVVTHPQARGRGLARRLLEAALAHVDQHYDAAKLHTGIPELYARFGFVEVPTHRFVSARRGGGGPGRRLDPADPSDAVRLRETFAARAPASDRLATRDPGWLSAIDSALAGALDRWWHAPGGPHPGSDAWMAAFEVRDETLHLYDVVGAARIGLEAVLAMVPERFERVVYAFSPDLLDPDAAPEPIPRDQGVMQVRGRWPGGPPIGVPPPWEH